MKLTVNFARNNFFCLRQFFLKKRMCQKKVSKHHGYRKKEQKKFFFRKTGLPEKPDYLRLFFPCSFPKVNSLQAHIKKSQNRSLIYVMSRSLSFPTVFHFLFVFVFRISFASFKNIHFVFVL